MPSQLALAVGLALGAAPPVILANPTGPVVVHGQAQFTAQGNKLTVTNSPSAIINWQGFSIGQGELTRFQQQNAASAVLNRVIGADPSSILGTLSSNGRVFLINPNGLIFGAGSVIDTQGFLASTLNIADRDFLEGRLRFEGTGGAIRNYGAISGGAGDVFLIAPSVTNAGAITSQGGRVVLAAGQKVEIGTTGLEGIRFEVQAPNDEALNLGRLEGGAVGVFAGSLKHSGDIRASTLAREGGKIVLKAAGDAIVEGGSITATGSRGGEAQVLGDRVGLLGSAAIDVSGEQGGGTVLVGGDFQGRNPEVQNARRTYVGPDAAIRADATVSGDGGKVIVWSDEVTRSYGQVSARGGPEGGDGGFVEISGKQYLDFTGRVDTRAPAGRAGALLLDPQDLTINDGPNAFGVGAGFSGGIFSSTQDASSSAISWGTLLEQLAGANVILTTSDANPNDGAGDITVQTGRSFTSDNSLSFLAHRVIAVNGAIENNGGGALTFVSGWDGVDVANPTVNIFSGGININAPVTAVGPISLVTGGSVNLRNEVQSRTAISVQSTGVVINQPVSQTSLDAGTGTLTVSSLGGVDVKFGADVGSADLIAGKFVFTRGGGGIIRNTTTFGPVRTQFNQIDLRYDGSNGTNAEVYISNNEGAGGPVNITRLDLATVVGLPAIRTRIENNGDLLLSGVVEPKSGQLSLTSTDPAGKVEITGAASWLSSAGKFIVVANDVEIGAPVTAGIMTIQARRDTGLAGSPYLRGINLGQGETGRLSLSAAEFDRIKTDSLTLTGTDLLVNAPTASATVQNLITGYGMPVVVNAPLTLSHLNSGLLLATPRLDVNAGGGISTGASGIQIGGDRIGTLIGIPEGDKPRNTNTVELSNTELQRFSTTGAVIIGGNFSEGGPAGMKQMGAVDLTGVTQRLLLQANGVSQDPGATLTVEQLGIRSSGPVNLTEANAFRYFAAASVGGFEGSPVNFVVNGGTPEGGLTITALDTPLPNFKFTSTFGVNTTGNVSLASTGKMLQDASVRASRLDLQASGGIAFTDTGNRVNVLNVTGAGGDLAFTNSLASKQSVAGIAGVIGNISLTSTSSATISLDGAVEVASLMKLTAIGGPLAVGTAGTLRGFGAVDVGTTGAPLQVDGTLAPGNGFKIGTLTLQGDVALGPGGKFDVRLGGTGVGEFDRLAVTGNAALNGTFTAALEKWTPVAGDAFPVLSFGTRSGAFATHNLPADFVHTYNGNDLTLTRTGVAAGLFWDNQTGNFLWTDPLNWSLDRLPGTTDDVTITAGAGSLVHLNSGDHVIQGLVVGSSKDLSIDNASLTVSGAATIDGSLTLGLLGGFSANGTASIANLSHRGTIDGKGGITVGTMLWRDGATVRGGGAFAVNGALTLGDADHGKVGPRPLVLDGRGVQANGAVTHESQSTLVINNGGVFNANASFAATSGAIIVEGDTSRFNLGAGASFTKSDVGRFDISGLFNTAAGSKINVQGGQTVFASGFSKATAETALAGRFDVAAGAALDFTSGEYRFADTALVSNAGILRVAGAGLRFAAGSTAAARIDNLAGGQVELAGTNSVTLGISNAGTLTAVAGSPYGAHLSTIFSGAYSGSGGVQVVDGLLDLRGRDSVLGGVSVHPLGTLALNGAGAHSIADLTLRGTFDGSGSVTVGTMAWRDNGTVRGSGAFAVNGALTLGDADHGKAGPRPLVLDGRGVQANGAVTHESQSTLVISNGGSLNANASFAASSGAIIVEGDTSRFNLGAGASFAKSEAGRFDISGLFNTAAGSKINVQGGQLVFASGFSKATAETALAGRFDVAAGAALDFTSGEYRFADTALVSNAGILRVAGAGLRFAAGSTAAARIDNLAGGQVELAGTNSVTLGISNAGTLTALAGSPYGDNVLSILSGGVTAGAGSTLNVSTGTVELRQSFANEGLVDVGAGATLRQAAGTLTNAAAGTLSGSGTIDVSASGAPLRNSGTIAPSGPRSLAGTLTVQGDLAMGPTGRLLVGQRVGGSDQLAVTGHASLDGALQFTPLPLFVAGEDTAITAMTYGSRSGAFATVTAPANLHPVYPNGRVDLVYSPFAPSISWDNSSGDGQWTNPLNWNLDRLPAGTDNVLVSLNGQSTVRHSSGHDEANALYSRESIWASGGRLTVNGTSGFGNELRITDLAEVILKGSATARSVILDGPARVYEITSFNNSETSPPFDGAIQNVERSLLLPTGGLSVTQSYIQTGGYLGSKDNYLADAQGNMVETQPQRGSLTIEPGASFLWTAGRVTNMNVTLRAPSANPSPEFRRIASGSNFGITVAGRPVDYLLINGAGQVIGTRRLELPVPTTGVVFLEDTFLRNEGALLIDGASIESASPMLQLVSGNFFGQIVRSVQPVTSFVQHPIDNAGQILIRDANLYALNVNNTGVVKTAERGVDPATGGTFLGNTSSNIGPDVNPYYTDPVERLALEPIVQATKEGYLPSSRFGEVRVAGNTLQITAGEVNLRGAGVNTNVLVMPNGTLNIVPAAQSFGGTGTIHVNRGGMMNVVRDELLMTLGGNYIIDGNLRTTYNGPLIEQTVTDSRQRTLTELLLSFPKNELVMSGSLSGTGSVQLGPVPANFERFIITRDNFGEHRVLAQEVSFQLSNSFTVTGTLTPGSAGGPGTFLVAGNLLCSGCKLAVNATSAGHGRVEAFDVVTFRNQGANQQPRVIFQPTGFVPTVGSTFDVVRGRDLQVLSNGSVPTFLQIDTPVGLGMGYNLLPDMLRLEVVSVTPQILPFPLALGGPVAFTQSQAVNAFAQAAAAAGVANAAQSPGITKKGFGSGKVNLVVVP